MITSWDIYWITRLDDLCVFFIFFFIISLIFLLIFAVSHAVINEEKPKFAIKYFIALMIFLFISVFIPSTKQAVVIYALPKIANNENINQIPDNFAKLINAKMQDWLSDLEGKKQQK